MSRPSFQFYTKDWRANSKLRRCSPAARGVWIDILCALHDADEYGIARYPLKELASEVGASPAHVRELVDKGVLKGSDSTLPEPFVYVPRSGRKDGPSVTLIPGQKGPLWYSSRMVKDEYVNTHRGEGTRFGEGKGGAPKSSPTRREGDGPSTASSSATAVAKKPPSGVSRKRAADPPKPDDVAEDVWRDWLTLRRTKRAAVTPTVIEGVRAEAAKAEMTLEAFLRVWCRRGSQGLEASWLKPDERPSRLNGAPINRQLAIEAENRRVADEWLQGGTR